jgi:23S rRNA (guanosine2251-2'-O)-methyltransferase
MELVYGIHSVSERIKTNPGLIERIYVARGTSNRNLQETINLARKLGLTLKFESRSVLDHKTNHASHQGVVAVCAPQHYAEFDEILGDLSPQTTLVLLDCIEDPRNLGAILRSCAAFSVGGVILPKDHAVGISSIVSKTAAGALEHLRIARVTNLTRSIQALKEKGVWVIGIESGQERFCHEADYSGISALVFGNEGKGLRRLVRESCDVLLSIPTSGAVKSLNVSVAVGVVLYECVRSKLGKATAQACKILPGDS